MVSKAIEEAEDSLLTGEVRKRVEELAWACNRRMANAFTKERKQAAFMAWVTEHFAKIYVVLDGLCVNLDRAEQRLESVRGTGDPAPGN
jgi:hypothetical protein